MHSLKFDKFIKQWIEQYKIRNSMLNNKNTNQCMSEKNKLKYYLDLIDLFGTLGP